jgi:hypothetical protein
MGVDMSQIAVRRLEPDSDFEGHLVPASLEREDADDPSAWIYLADVAFSTGCRLQAEALIEKAYNAYDAAIRQGCVPGSETFEEETGVDVE